MAAASPDDDVLRDALDANLRELLTDAVARRTVINQAVRVMRAAIEERKATVTTKAREAAEGVRLLARYDEFVARGHAHNAAMMVAREFGEPHEWETIADRVRRLRAKREKTR